VLVPEVPSTATQSVLEAQDTARRSRPGSMLSALDHVPVAGAGVEVVKLAVGAVDGAVEPALGVAETIGAEDAGDGLVELPQALAMAPARTQVASAAANRALPGMRIGPVARVVMLGTSP